MKKQIIAITAGLLALVMLSGIAFSADKKKGPSKDKDKKCKMGKPGKGFQGPYGDLKLTKEQHEKIRAIMKEAREKIEKEVLTDEQRKTLAENREKMKKEMAKRGPYGGLDLTDAQQEKVNTIMKEAWEAAEKAETKEAKMEIWKAAHEKIKKEVLTDDQRKKLEENMEKMKKKMAARGPFGGLDLTEEQQKKVDAIMKEAWKKTKKAETKEEKQKIMKAAFEEIKKDVLTEEQRKKLEERKEKHKGERGGNNKEHRRHKGDAEDKDNK